MSGIWWQGVVVGNCWRIGVVGIGKLSSLQVSWVDSSRAWLIVLGGHVRIVDGGESGW